MERSLWIAKTGLDAMQTRMAVVSNNLANVNTTGFKKDRAVFEDLLYQNVRQSGAQTTEDTQMPAGLNLGTGVRVVATEKQHTQGNIVSTDNALDMAINGRGFFQIAMPDGSTSYTRDGSFQVNSSGQIVNSDGYLLQPGITIPENVLSVTVSRDGIISVQEQGATTSTEVGSIQLADFINPTGLQPLGDNLFSETSSSGTASAATPGLNGIGSVMQGSIEASNVNVAEELVNMIETQRAYEVNSKAISTTDAMLQYVANQL
ncbi:flagellar basal-body rod protein FlgG [Solemya pervernicosa gill symbiont]|uniref:Flagellar basal-body rod protein FlgG n=1 Tax=Solemya pervernicosa gill symbiont TaxID=642797 RepID=A0A1T2L8U1_9GAMM|nr:flagellar basal-body rod protein FlgG [Solemya pervernicosa gill symbiont]OOZ41501.1 flagellar basal-body rod protein FlgG [Solemya pervernicosa gill symbiont]